MNRWLGGLALLFVSAIAFGQGESRHNHSVLSDADPSALRPFIDGPLILSDKPGDFTMYLDRRESEADYYVGWLFIGDSTYILCRIQKETREKTLFILEYRWIPGESQPQIKRVAPLEGPDDPEMTKTVQRMLYDFFGIRHLRERFVFSLGETGTPFYEAREGRELLPGTDRTLGFDFRYWVPVHQLYGLWDQNLDTPGMTLVGIGHVTDVRDPIFYDFREPSNVRSGPIYTVDEKPREMTELGGLRVPLDGNWMKDAAGMMVIARETLRDAVVHTEEVDLTDLGVDLPTLIKYTLLYHGVSVDPRSVKLEVINGFETLFFRIYDPNTRTVTQAIDIFVPVEDHPGRYRIFNFNAFATFYEANQEYFHKILF